MEIQKSYQTSDFLQHIKESTDKTKNSQTYESLSLSANVVNEFYENLKVLSDELFAKTQSIDFLEQKALERGITKRLATSSYLLLECNTKISIGDRFTLSELTYIVTEEIDDYKYIVMCEQTGKIGNKYLGKATPINYIENLTQAFIKEVLIPSRDDESVESLRTRYFETFSIQPYGGNKKDYLKLCQEIDGVYSVKVKRAGMGKGTSIVYVLSNELKKPTDSLISLVLDTLTPNANGSGKLPLGHKVYVKPCVETTINISLVVLLKNGNNSDTLDFKMKENINAYFEDIKKNWHTTNYNELIRISYLTDYILKDTNIKDIFNIKINGQTKNLELDIYSIPILNSVNTNIIGG